MNRPARIVVTAPPEVAASPDTHVPEPMSHAVPKTRNTTFWVAFALAMLVHSAPLMWPFLWIGQADPLTQKRMGERDGDPEAMTVDVMDEAGLASLATPPPTPPPAPEVAPQPAVPLMQQPKPQQPAEAAKPPEQVAMAVPDTPGDFQAERPPQKKPAEQAELMKELVELFAPEPVRNNPAKEQAQPSPPRDPSEPRPVLDTPMEFQFSQGGVGRPVDITRSGENDEFGRNVVRALRETMPNPYLLNGTVGIKFLVSETGQLLELQLVKSSGYPILDQSIVLAVNRSKFPVPARGSKLADRVFLVMYVYEAARRR